MNLSLLQTDLMTQNLQTFLNGIMSVLPRLIGGFVFIILGFIIAKVVANLTKKLFKKLKIDRLGERLNDIELISKSNVDIKISQVASKIIYYFILLIFIVAATDIIGMPAISNLFNDMLNWIPNLLVAMVILVLGLLFSEVIRKAVLTACQSLGIPSAKLISLMAFYFLFINIVISALSQAKVDTAFISSNLSILIGAGAFAFAIGYGLASKDVIANFLASYYTKGKFHIGDHIRVDNTQGVITEMDRSTVTVVADGMKIIIPLSKLTQEKVEFLKSEKG
jgi:hypothetical protein